MKGDRVLCMNPACYHLFKSIHDDIHDTRNPKNKDLCPYCGGTNTVNIKGLVDKYWKCHGNLIIPGFEARALQIAKDKGVNFKRVKQQP